MTVRWKRSKKPQTRLFSEEFTALNSAEFTYFQCALNTENTQKKNRNTEKKRCENTPKKCTRAQLACVQVSTSTSGPVSPMSSPSLPSPDRCEVFQPFLTPPSEPTLPGASDDVLNAAVDGCSAVERCASPTCCCVFRVFFVLIVCFVCV